MKADTFGRCKCSRDNAVCLGCLIAARVTDKNQKIIAQGDKNLMRPKQSVVVVTVGGRKLPTHNPTRTVRCPAQRSAQKFRIVGWVKPQGTEVRGVLLQRLQAMTDTEGLALLDEVSNIFHL